MRPSARAERIDGAFAGEVRVAGSGERKVVAGVEIDLDSVVRRIRIAGPAGRESGRADSIEPTVDRIESVIRHVRRAPRNPAPSHVAIRGKPAVSEVIAVEQRAVERRRGVDAT